MFSDYNGSSLETEYQKIREIHKYREMKHTLLPDQWVRDIKGKLENTLR